MSVALVESGSFFFLWRASAFGKTCHTLSPILHIFVSQVRLMWCFLFLFRNYTLKIRRGVKGELCVNKPDLNYMLSLRTLSGYYTVPSSLIEVKCWLKNVWSQRSDKNFFKCFEDFYVYIIIALSSILTLQVRKTSLCRQ